MCVHLLWSCNVQSLTSLGLLQSLTNLMAVGVLPSRLPPPPTRRAAPPVAPPASTKQPTPQTAAKHAAEQHRAAARQNRAKPGGIDAIRAKVKAEIKAEAAAVNAKTRARLEEKEEEYRQEQEARKLEIERLQARGRRQQPAAPPVAPAPPPPVASHAAGQPGADAVQQLLRDRSESIRQVSEQAHAMRERLVARRVDRSRWGDGPPPQLPPSSSTAAPDTTSSVGGPSRSLFTWAAPPPRAEAHNGSSDVGAPRGASDAARSAWDWVQQRPATTTASPGLDAAG